MRLIRLLKKDLARESTGWVSKGIISAGQAEAICWVYGIDYHKQNDHSFGYHVLVALGYLFVGLAVITLIGENWEDIPRATRMSGLIGLTLCVNLLGVYNFNKGKTTGSVGWFFLGGLFYGASIMLIAQIYHIGEHYPDGIFWWAAGVLPAAILLQSAILMMLATTLALIWFFVESSLSFYPALFPLFIAALAWFAVYGKQSIILFLALVATFGLWAEYTLSWFLSDFPGFLVGPENIALCGVLFIFFHSVSKWLTEKKDPKFIDYGTVLSVWVLRFCILTLIIFSFKEPWHGLIAENWQMPALIFTIAGMVSVLAVVVAYTANKQMGSTAIAAGLYLLALFLVIQGENQYINDLTLQISDNIILIGLSIWLIVKGINKGISHYFFLGVFSILTTGLLRYVDLMGDYIGTAILFAVFSVILLSSARYWKSQNNHENGVS